MASRLSVVLQLPRSCMRLVLYDVPVQADPWEAHTLSPRPPQGCSRNPSSTVPLTELMTKYQAENEQEIRMTKYQAEKDNVQSVIVTDVAVSAKSGMSGFDTLPRHNGNERWRKRSLNADVKSDSAEPICKFKNSDYSSE